MPAPDLSAPRYDVVSIRLHWATAVLVSVLWIMGRTTGFMPRGPARVDVWSVHVLLGTALACILLARIVWRLTGASRPPPEPAGAAWMAAATVVHALLYLLMLTVVILGITNVFGHGFPLFGRWILPRIGDDAFKARINGWHGLAANAVAGLALLHACAALFHHLVLKDRVLARMAPAVHRA